MCHHLWDLVVLGVLCVPSLLPCILPYFQDTQVDLCFLDNQVNPGHLKDHMDQEDHSHQLGLSPLHILGRWRYSFLHS